MSKFKVGDRVRVATMNWGAEQHGKTGTVTNNNPDSFAGLTVTIKYDVPMKSGLTTNAYAESELEHIYTSCAAAEVDNLADEYGAPKAKFKVGDRVRITDAALYRHNVVKVGDLATITENDYGDNYVLNVETEAEGTIEQWGGSDTFEHVAVAPATAALRTEAGKFYKTRDGRKALVGNNDNDVTYPFYHTVDGKGWHGITRDGKSCIGFSHQDLIAEWTDEPVAAPAAKFKVGDKLTKRNGYWREEGYEVKKIEGDRVYLDDTFGGSVPYKANDEELVVVKPSVSSIADIVARHSQTGTAIVAVLEDGQPRPATRPYVHTSTGAAETEANRLARTNPGKEFGVYTLGTVAKVERVYEHEWQRLAVSGKTYEAKTALTKVAGIEFFQSAMIVNDWLDAEAA